MRAILATPKPCPTPAGRPFLARPPRDLVALLSRTPRETLEMIIDAAIDELDRRDGDPDAEPEEDACAAGDDDPSPAARRLGEGRHVA